jgi:protein TonB
MIDLERRRQAMDLGLALVVSAWLHLLVFAFIRYGVPLFRPSNPPLPALEIALAVPATIEPAAETGAARSKEKDTDAADEAADPGDEAAEDTISLESQAPKYLSYLQQVKTRIGGRWDLPAGPLPLDKGGRVTAVFTLGKGGELMRVRLVSSSGRPVLDEAALSAIRRAGPFPAFPEHIRLERLNIRAIFDYRIQRVGVE